MGWEPNGTIVSKQALASTVTRLVRRVPDRKDTLEDHEIVSWIRLSSVQRGLANKRMARGTPAWLTP